MSNEMVRRDELDLMTLGDVLCKSGFFRDASEHAKAVVKVLAGREFGLGPIASMSGIHVVEGKPTLSAHLMAVGIKRSGRYDYRVREHSDSVCAVEFFEVVDGKRESLGVSRYTIEDAVRADVARKSVWQKHPRPMLFARALSEGYRTFCPDALGLMGPTYVEGEIECEQPLTVQARVVTTPSGSDTGAPGASTAAESVRPAETTVSTAAPSASTHLPAALRSSPAKEALLARRAALKADVESLPEAAFVGLNKAKMLAEIEVLPVKRLESAEQWVQGQLVKHCVACAAADEGADPWTPHSEHMQPSAAPSDAATLGSPSGPASEGPSNRGQVPHNDEVLSDRDGVGSEVLGGPQDAAGGQLAGHGHGEGAEQDQQGVRGGGEVGQARSGAGGARRGAGQAPQGAATQGRGAGGGGQGSGGLTRSAAGAEPSAAPAPPGQFDPDLVSELEAGGEDDQAHAVSRAVNRVKVEQDESMLRASLTLDTAKLDALEQPVKPKRGRKPKAQQAEEGREVGAVPPGLARMPSEGGGDW